MLFFSLCLFFVVAAVVVSVFVCFYVLFFPFAKLVLYRFLTWFSVSLTCLSYIHVTFFCTLVLGSTDIVYYIPLKLSVISSFTLKVGGGQLESLRYFDHHTHFMTCTVII